MPIECKAHFVRSILVSAIFKKEIQDFCVIVGRGTDECLSNLN